MKYFIRILIVLLPMTGFGQKEKTLSEVLWSRVSHCYSMFEDMDEDGKPDYEKIDDSENGYLMIEGSWPTCGCSCNSTVAAYKNLNGEYVYLQRDIEQCSWNRQITSSLNLYDILPKDFGIQCFTSKRINDNIESPIFFIDFNIPRYGTDTKVTIKLVPFGLFPSGDEIICFGYKEDYQNHKYLYGIKDIAESSKSSKTIEYLLNGEFSKISQADYIVINEVIGDDDDSRFESIEEIQKYLKELKLIYDTYMLLEVKDIILGWDKKTSRFYIKESVSEHEETTFREFLILNEYWQWIC